MAWDLPWSRAGTSHTAQRLPPTGWGLSAGLRPRWPIQGCAPPPRQAGRWAAPGGCSLTPPAPYGKTRKADLKGKSHFSSETNNTRMHLKGSLLL